jgi:hypothetical protein
MPNNGSSKIHHLMPPIIRTLCWSYDAWIVGSTATSLIKHHRPQDWDIIINIELWNKCALFLSANPVVANSFGGWKVPHINADVWPDTLNNYFLRCQKSIDCAAYHPQSGILIKREFYNHGDSRDC